jgi:hypothetical protein
MLQQQIALLKISVPIISFMFILTGIDYLSRFGFALTLPSEGNDTIKEMVELLVRIIFTLTCVFWGSLAILKPNYAPCILLVAYITFNILMQLINFKFLSQFDEVDELTLFKTRTQVKLFSFWAFNCICVFVVVLSSKWIQLLAVSIPMFIALDVLCSSLEEETFSYIMVLDALIISVFNVLLFYYIRHLLLRQFMNQLEVEHQRDTMTNIFDNFPDAVLMLDDSILPQDKT